MASIMEALQNANYNLDNIKTIGTAIVPLVKEQLNNAVTLLEKGYDLDQEIEPLLEQYFSLQDVPHSDYHFEASGERP